MARKKVPYLKNTNMSTINGHVKTFNGIHHPIASDVFGARELSKLEIGEIVKVEWEFGHRYFLNGTEVDPHDYYIMR